MGPERGNGEREGASRLMTLQMVQQAETARAGTYMSEATAILDRWPRADPGATMATTTRHRAETQSDLFATPSNFIVVKDVPVSILGSRTTQAMDLINVNRDYSDGRSLQPYGFAKLGSQTTQAMDLINVNFDNIQMGQVLSNMVSPVKQLGKEALMRRHPSVFTGELGTFEGEVRSELDTAHRPTKMPLRTTPLASEEIKRLESLGVIEAVTVPTDLVSALVVTKRKDSGAIRVCLDPSALNKALCRCEYPLPTMEDILPRLSKSKVFTVRDIQQRILACSVGQTLQHAHDIYYIKWKIQMEKHTIRNKTCIRDLPAEAR